MSRYFVSRYTDGPVDRWNVIDRQTQEWIVRFSSEAAAEAHAQKLNLNEHVDPLLREALNTLWRII